MAAAAQPPLYLSGLTENDYATLALSWLDLETVERMRIRRVSSLEGRDIVGRKDHADYSGLVFPYHLPEVNHPRLERLRLDTPALEYDHSGKPHETRKYLAAPGSRNCLYFLPGTTGEDLADTNLPVWLTEGEKKTGALYRLARVGSSAGDKPRGLAVGLSGVWNWRGQIAIVPNAKGARQPVKGPISDLDLLCWQGRTVYVIFDANVTTNPAVRAARFQLSQELARRGAVVRWVEVPDVLGVNGIDDYLGRFGAAEGQRLMDQAMPADPGRELRAIIAAAKQQQNPGSLLEVQTVGLFALVSERELAQLIIEISQAFPRDFPKRAFVNAVKHARAGRGEQDEPGQTDQPVINVSGKSLPRMTEEAMEALRSAPDTPDVFVRGGELSRIVHDEKGSTSIESLTENSLRGILARAAHWEKQRPSGEVVPTPPPMETVRDLLSLGQWPFPALSGVITAPILRRDGGLLETPGYDESTRLFLAPAPGLVVPPVPDAPTPQDVRKAVALLLEEATGEFPLVGDADRANLLALMLTPVLREMIQGKVPLALLSAPTQGTGKSLLAELAAVISTGSSPAMGTAPENEAEWEKRITASLLTGAAFVVWDNVEDALNSPALASVLTSPEWRGRELGTSREVRLQQRATWVATGNNLRTAGDLCRRSYLIRLDAKMAKPYEGRSFRHKDLITWAQEHRGDLLAALLTLGRAWVVAGRPVPKNAPVMGSFEGWSRTMAGILEFAGVPGFLSNRGELAEADETTPQRAQFVLALLEAFCSKEFTVSDVVNRMQSHPDLQDLLPDECARQKTKGTNLQRILGSLFRCIQGARYGDEGARIAKVGMRHGSATWQVQYG